MERSEHPPFALTWLQWKPPPRPAVTAARPVQYPVVAVRRTVDVGFTQEVLFTEALPSEVDGLHVGTRWSPLAFSLLRSPSQLSRYEFEVFLGSIHA
jgi:hypothetical protein